MTATSPAAVLLDQVSAEDLIGCTSCGAQVTLIASGCIEGHRVCPACLGPDVVGEIDPPF